MKRIFIIWGCFCLFLLSLMFLVACSPKKPDPRKATPIIIESEQAQEINKQELNTIPPTIIRQFLVTNITRAVNSSGWCIGEYYTIQHEGHLYVVKYDGNMIHSPDCPCLKKNQIENKIENEEL